MQQTSDTLKLSGSARPKHANNTVNIAMDMLLFEGILLCVLLAIVLQLLDILWSPVVLTHVA